MTTLISTKNSSEQTTLISLEKRLEKSEHAIEKLIIIAQALLEKAETAQQNQIAHKANLSQVKEGFEAIVDALDEIRERIENNPERAVQENTTPSHFVCPGHSKFFHRYKGRERAKAKALAEVARISKDPYIKHVKYELIDSNNPEGKTSGYFGGLNAAFYNYAINIISYHVDDCRQCHYHPHYKKISK